MRRGERSRSYPRLVSALDWSSRSGGNKDVNRGNSRRGKAYSSTAGGGTTAGAGEEGRMRGR